MTAWLRLFDFGIGFLCLNPVVSALIVVGKKGVQRVQRDVVVLRHSWDVYQVMTPKARQRVQSDENEGQRDESFLWKFFVSRAPIGLALCICFVDPTLPTT